MKNRIRKFLFTISTFSFLFVGVDCKDDPPVIPPVTPPDTTSQDFTITTWEYGDGFASSFAKDAWVFDKNNIWVVGLFDGIDSANPQGYTLANIIRWDGVSWKPFANNTVHNSSGLNCIYAIDTSLIYFASGLLRKYKNGSIEPLYMNDIQFSSGQSIDYVWTSGENNVWGVGTRGMAVHYDGTEWKKVSFDSNYTFNSITGSKKTGVAYASALGQGSRLIELANNTAGVLLTLTDVATAAVHDVLVFDEKTLWVGGSALRSFSLETNTSSFLRNPDSVFVNAISMASANDIYFLCETYAPEGWRPLFMHYNGIRFTVFDLPKYTFSLNHGISAISGLAVIAAEADNKALIITIRRNQQ